MRLPTAARGWAYAGVILGATVSVAANVMHSYIPPEKWPVGADWTPERGQVIGAAIWPLALAISSEVLARTTWGKHGRWIGGGGVAVVALVAAIVSYIHLNGLLAHWGEHEITTVIGPLAVDGLMVVSTAALLAGGSASPTVAVPVAHIPEAPPARPATRQVAELADPPTASANGAAEAVAGGSAKSATPAANRRPKRPATPAANPAAKQSANGGANGGVSAVADPPDPRVGGTPEQRATWLAEVLADGARTVKEIQLMTGWSEGTARRTLAAAELAAGGPSATGETAGDEPGQARGMA